MKKKVFTSLGLMTGTSMDGIDLSIIKSDGYTEFVTVLDDYFEFDGHIYEKLIDLRSKIISAQDLKRYSEELNLIEKEITLFHSKVVKKVSNNINDEIDLIGFHGQTIYHNPDEKISRQLGNGKLLNQLTKKDIVFNFRKNDILNEGQGAPLTPLFHHLISIKNEIRLPVCFLNIGGISNITVVKDRENLSELVSKDIGPGNCLIDAWVRKNSSRKFDQDGKLASSGIKNEIIFEQAQELFSNRPNKKTLSFDVNDFDVSFARGLSLEDGATTLTDFTARVIGSTLFSLLSKVSNKTWKVLVCGGGRKNKVLIEKIKKNTLKNIEIQSIDNYEINGDFVESQAFAFLAIRSILKLPISFPNTTGCLKPCSGGELIKN